MAFQNTYCRTEEEFIWDNYEFLRTLDPINVEYKPHALELVQDLVSGVSSIVDMVRNTPYKEHYKLYL